MALYRFELTHGTRKGGQSAGAKYDYISRSEKYEQHQDRCLHIESHLPPGFAEAKHFWRGADKNERANARLFSEMKISLPVELSLDKQVSAVKRLVSEIIPDQPYTMAFHEGKGYNPHCHLIFSGRVIDDVKRDPAIYFKRVNKKSPELGGAVKNRLLLEKLWLENSRSSWASVANEALAANATMLQKIRNKIPQIDHRSWKDRGAEQPIPAALTKNIKSQIKRHLENNNDITSQSSSLDQRRVQDLESRVQDFAVTERRDSKEAFKWIYEHSRCTTQDNVRIRKATKESRVAFGNFGESSELTFEFFERRNRETIPGRDEARAERAKIDNDSFLTSLSRLREQPKRARRDNQPTLGDFKLLERKIEPCYERAQRQRTGMAHCLEFIKGLHAEGMHAINLITGRIEDLLSHIGRQCHSAKSFVSSFIPQDLNFDIPGDSKYEPHQELTLDEFEPPAKAILTLPAIQGKAVAKKKVKIEQAAELTAADDNPFRSIRRPIKPAKSIGVYRGPKM